MRWQIRRSVSKTGIWTSAIRKDGKYLNFPWDVLIGLKKYTAFYIWLVLYWGLA